MSTRDNWAEAVRSAGDSILKLADENGWSDLLLHLVCLDIARYLLSRSLSNEKPTEGYSEN